MKVITRWSGFGWAFALAVGLGPAVAAQEATTSVSPRPLPTLPPAPQVSAPQTGATGGIPSGRPLTVQEAVRIALARHPDIDSARAGVRSAAGALQTQSSARWPQVSASLSQSLSRPVDIVTSTSSQVTPGGGSTGSGGTGGSFSTSRLTLSGSTGLQASQLLYDFGLTSANIAAAREDLKAAEHDVRATRADVVVNVKTAFYTLVQNRRLRVVAERQFQDQQAHLDEARSRFRAGVVAVGDVARALASVASAETSLAQAQRDEENARLVLNQQMGIDPATSVVAAEEEEAVPDAQAAALVKQALAARPELRRAAANVDAAEQRTRAARKGNLPTISAVGGLSTSNTSPNSTLQASPFVGISLSATPFDSGATRGRVEQAQASVDSARASRRSLELEISRQVLAAHLDMQTAQQQIRSSEAEVASAEESVRVSLGRYRTGLGTFLDVTDAQSTLNDARVRQVNARAKLSAAVANLLYQLGEPADVAAETPAQSAAPFTLPASVR